MAQKYITAYALTHGIVLVEVTREIGHLSKRYDQSVLEGKYITTGWVVKWDSYGRMPHKCRIGCSESAHDLPNTRTFDPEWCHDTLEAAQEHVRKLVSEQIAKLSKLLDGVRVVSVATIPTDAEDEDEDDSDYDDE